MYRLVIIMLLTASGCSNPNHHEIAEDIKEIDLNLSNPSQTPNLYVLQDTFYMVWTEEDMETTKLYFSKRCNNQEVLRTLVASGTDWFVNWADFSSLIVDPKNPNIIITHWLEKSNEGTYDYDIKISTSDDGGKSWYAPKTLHNDGIAAEHGFVSMANYDDDHFYASWLDGRNTKTPNPIDLTKHLPMTIRGGLIDKETLVIEEKELDRKVCDCCQTASVKTTYGMLTAYRDRSDDEIRDINLVHFDTQEVIYQSNDQWKINGCPVNGPALASYDGHVALAYYTAADGPSSWLVLSSDQFNTHQKIQIDNGNPLGRVDVEMTDEKTYVTWMEIEEKTAAIRMKTIQNSDGHIINDLLVATVTNSRRTGFPRLKILNNSAYIAYTTVLDADRTDIRLSKLDL